MVPCDWNSVLSVSLIIILCNFESITALRCFSCHSSTDSNCKYVQTELTSPASDCATQCYVFLSADAGLTERGCLGSSSSSCSQLPLGATCEKCTTDLCNSQQLSYDKCAVCDSTIDPDCDITSSTTKVIPCPGSTGQKRGCYRYSESWDGQVTRGCVSQLSVELFRVCSENGPNCKTCEGDGCNLKHAFQSCFICDSDVDPQCLNLDPQVDHEFAGYCRDYLDSCAAYVIPGGKTARGCSKEIHSEPTYCPSTNCEICSDPDCNHGVVPFNRLQCYQCNSTADPGCNAPQFGNPNQAPAPCSTFKYDDQCYKYWDADNSIGYRGCLSDGNAIVEACATEPERCSICNYSTCNNEYLIRDSGLWCVHCNQTEACMWSSKSPISKCERPVTFYEIESCYQYLLPSGLSAERGCVLDDEELCGEGGDACEQCRTHFCNGASYLSQSCVRCNSADSLLCEEGASEIAGDQCIVDPSYSQRGCYSFRDELDVVHRGCYFDMEDDWRANCETTHQNRCTRCFGQNCNTNEQGSGSIVTVSRQVLIAGLLLWVAVALPSNGLLM